MKRFGESGVGRWQKSRKSRRVSNFVERELCTKTVFAGEDIRKRLSNFSWWMRLLCQRVAQRANNEEKERGKFFQDRYGATRLTDEASLLACAAYVDLNPIRAAMAMALESSDHTSVQTRIEAMTMHDADQENNEHHAPKDAFLSPLSFRGVASLHPFQKTDFLRIPLSDK